MPFWEYGKIKYKKRENRTVLLLGMWTWYRHERVIKTSAGSIWWTASALIPWPGGNSSTPELQTAGLLMQWQPPELFHSSFKWSQWQVSPHASLERCMLSLIDRPISKANFSCYSAKIFLLLNFSPSLLVMPPVSLPELPHYSFIDLGSVIPNSLNSPWQYQGSNGAGESLFLGFLVCRAQRGMQWKSLVLLSKLSEWPYGVVKSDLSFPQVLRCLSFHSYGGEGVVCKHLCCWMSTQVSWNQKVPH